MTKEQLNIINKSMCDFAEENLQVGLIRTRVKNAFNGMTVRDVLSLAGVHQLYGFRYIGKKIGTAIVDAFSKYDLHIGMSLKEEHEELLGWPVRRHSDEKFFLMSILVAILYPSSTSIFDALDNAEEIYSHCLGAYSYSFTQTEEAKLIHDIVNGFNKPTND